MYDELSPKIWRIFKNKEHENQERLTDFSAEFQNEQ